MPLAVLIVAALALGAAAPEPSNKNTSPNSNSAAKIEAAAPTPPPLKQQAVESTLYEQPCRNTPKDRQSDLCAQWEAADAARDAAWWAMFAAFVAIVGTVGLWAQIYLTRKAVEDTSEATEAMRAANEIAREDTRPILAFSGIGWEQFGDTPEKQLAHFLWRNAGKRPIRLLRLEIGRAQTPQGQQPDWNAVLPAFETLQRDSAGLIIMPDGTHQSIGIMVMREHFQEGQVSSVYLLARATYTNAISGEHDREFSTLLGVQVFPVVQPVRPPNWPAQVEWNVGPGILILGVIQGDVLSYEMRSVDNPAAVQMT